MTRQVFTWLHRVTYAECTVGNHVYYGRYLEYLEKARGEFFRELGLTMTALQDRGVIFPVTECRLKYLGPARYDDRLSLEVWMESIRRVRLTFAYLIVHEHGNILVEAATEHACTDLQDQPTRIPDDLARPLRAYLHAPGDSAKNEQRN